MFPPRVSSVPGETSVYRLKVWEEGRTEPNAWDLEARGALLELTRGSILLASHHTAAGFGPVDVTPIDLPAT